MKDTHLLIKSVDQTAQGTSLVDDSELQFVAEPNTTWALHFDLINSADDVVGQNDRVKMAVKAPSSATATVYCFAIVNDGTNGVTAPAQGPLTPLVQGTPGSTFAFGAPGATQNPAYSWIRIAAIVQMGADPGPIGLQFAEVASASATGAVMYAGSTLLAKRCN